ncbi:MAG: polysaccharide deacetylase family protein, partial [Planctomycetota bacterium]|nr:polysaccharide deacetylase family protein [Planctomycetota bacterium]
MSLAGKALGWCRRELRRKLCDVDARKRADRVGAGTDNWILAYHTVAPRENMFTRGMHVTTTAALFREHIAVIRRYYRFVPLEALVEAVESGKVLPRTVALTFDDGYRSFIDHVLPVLRRYSIPATLFVSPAFCTGDRLGWRSKYAYLVNSGHAGLLLDRICRSYPLEEMKVARP